MNCKICGQEVTGDLFVQDSALADGTPVVAILSTPDRDWICCDSCNTVVCHACCKYHQSGYCDSCVEKYNLRDYLVELGLIEREGGGGGV